MKKFALMLLPVMAASLLASCGHNSTAPKSYKADNTRQNTVSARQDESQIPMPLPFPDPKPRIKIDLSGVRRHFKKSLEGEYSVEYIHCGDMKSDFDCKLTIADGNNYEMSFTKNGSTVEHRGKWYSRRGSVTFFFDEEKPVYVPEVYYPDSISADIIDGGKLMMYDGSCVIVLSQDNANIYNG